MAARQPGRAVQVDPIKPKLKPPGAKRLKHKHDEPLSSFAFKFNLRRYNPVKRAVHLTLHQRQFIEEGNPGSLRLHGRQGQAQLAYLAEGKGGALVLGKFGFDPMSVRRMPPEDVKWKFGTCAVAGGC